MVQIPRLQQLETGPAQPRTERIKIQAPTGAQSILKRTQALASLGGEAAALYQDVENDKIKNLSAESEHEFNTWNIQKLQELKSFEGDPTDAYAQYDLDVKEKHDSILASRPDLNERVKRHVTSHLDGVVRNQNYQAIKQRGAQQETYEHNLFESSVKLKRNNLPVNAGHIKVDNPGSYFPFEQGMNDLKTTIAQRAVKKGSATELPADAKEFTHMYQDADGKIVKVKMNDAAKQRTAQELSKGVSDSIKGMINAGYTEEAKQAYDRYKAYVDPKTKLAIDKKLKTDNSKKEGKRIYTEIQGKSNEEQNKAIEKIKDPDIKIEVLNYRETINNRMEKNRKRKNDANYESLSNVVLTRMNSDSPYHGVSDLEDDPMYKETWENLDTKSRKAITEMVKSPTKTAPKSEANIQNLFFGNDVANKIEDISPTQFQTYLSGLSQTDRSKYTGMYNRLKIQSAGEERATFKRGSELLLNQFLVDEHIERDKYGKIRGDDEITMIKAQNKLIDHLATQPQLSDKDLKDFVKEFSAAEIKGKVFNPQPRAVFNTRAGGTPVVNTATSENEIQLSPADMISMKRKFKEQNGYFPTTKDAKFKNFVESNL